MPPADPSPPSHTPPHLPLPIASRQQPLPSAHARSNAAPTPASARLSVGSTALHSRTHSALRHLPTPLASTHLRPTPPIAPGHGQCNPRPRRHCTNPLPTGAGLDPRPSRIALPPALCLPPYCLQLLCQVFARPGGVVLSCHAAIPPTCSASPTAPSAPAAAVSSPVVGGSARDSAASLYSSSITPATVAGRLPPTVLAASRCIAAAAVGDRIPSTWWWWWC